jgi:dihydroorotase
MQLDRRTSGYFRAWRAFKWFWPPVKLDVTMRDPLRPNLTEGPNRESKKFLILAMIFFPAMQASAQSEHYDLLLKTGHVIDPANHIDAVMDVAVANRRIAAVEKNIPANYAGKVVDASGLYVTAGLIDIHYHVGHGGAPLNWFAPEARSHDAPLGVFADLALQSGVTTVVDAGSAGADTFLREKEEVIDRAQVRVLAFLNIVANGMRGGLEQTVGQMDPERCAGTIEKYKDIIVGVKTAHYWTEGAWDPEHPPWAAVDRAVECSKAAADVPVMFDFWPRPDRSYADLILQKMRPGDIHTHVFAQQFPIVLPDGKLNPIMDEARRRGVFFDVGHGAASFWFRNAVPAVTQGFIPDSISTDLHTGNYRIVSMTEVISKFLAMGVPLQDLIVRSTVNPAREIGRPELGTLSVGQEADIAVLEELHGDFGYIDCGYSKMSGKVKLLARMTVRAGRILYDPSGLSMVEWEKARPQYFNTPIFGNSPPAKADDYPRE